MARGQIFPAVARINFKTKLSKTEIFCSLPTLACRNFTLNVTRFQHNFAWFNLAVSDFSAISTYCCDVLPVGGF